MDRQISTDHFLFLGQPNTHHGLEAAIDNKAANEREATPDHRADKLWLDNECYCHHSFLGVGCLLGSKFGLGALTIGNVIAL